jgi:hypothetical protein
MNNTNLFLLFLINFPILLIFDRKRNSKNIGLIYMNYCRIFVLLVIISYTYDHGFFLKDMIFHMYVLSFLNWLLFAFFYWKNINPKETK